VRSKSEITQDSQQVNDLSKKQSIQEQALNTHELREASNSRLKELADTLSESELALLAKAKGLSLKEEIKFIKHTYSVREEHKEKFKFFCNRLGKSMQHGMSEMMEDFFKKYEKKVNIIEKAFDDKNSF
jgi:hypothetical protein